MMTIKLTKPLTVKGEEVTEVTLDFDALCGTDMLAVEQQTRAFGEGYLVAEITGTYAMILASRMIGVPPEDISALPAKDYLNIVSKVKDFLLR